MCEERRVPELVSCCTTVSAVTRRGGDIMCETEMSGWKSTSIDFLIIPAGYSTVSGEIYCGCRKAMPGQAMTSIYPIFVSLTKH